MYIANFFKLKLCILACFSLYNSMSGVFVLVFLYVVLYLHGNGLRKEMTDDK